MLQEAVALLFSKECVQSRVKMSIYIPFKISIIDIQNILALVALYILESYVNKF